MKGLYIKVDLKKVYGPLQIHAGNRKLAEEKRDHVVAESNLSLNGAHNQALVRLSR